MPSSLASSRSGGIRPSVVPPSSISRRSRERVSFVAIHCRPHLAPPHAGGPPMTAHAYQGVGARVNPLVSQWFDAASVHGDAAWCATPGSFLTTWSLRWLLSRHRCRTFGTNRGPLSNVVAGNDRDGAMRIEREAARGHNLRDRARSAACRRLQAQHGAVLGDRQERRP